MENCYNGSDAYYALLYCNADDQFKLRRDASWDVNRGLPEAGVIEPGYYYLQQNGANIQMSRNGVYEVFWYPEYEEVGIYYPGQRPSWSITGSIEGMDWSGDHWADGGAFDNDGQTKWPLLAYKIVYRAGQEFKFRFGGDWFLEYGVNAEWGGQFTFTDGDTIDLRKGGPNIQLDQDGIYWVYFDPSREQAHIYWEADLPKSAIDIDGDFSDWDALDAKYVSTAYGDPNAPYSVLQMMKAYADMDALYVYFEYDLSKIHPEPDVEYVPFHIWINSDNDNYTGMWTSYFYNAGVDYLLESFLYNEGNLDYMEAGLFQYAGPDCEESWAWKEYASGVSYGAGDGKGAYEIRLDRSRLPIYDIFTIGIDIQEQWSSVGILPNAAPTEENPSGIAPLLYVNTFYNNTVYL